MPDVFRIQSCEIQGEVFRETDRAGALEGEPKQFLGTGSEVNGGRLDLSD